MLEYRFYQKTGILPGREKTSPIFNLNSKKTQSRKQEDTQRHIAQMSQYWPMQAYYSLICLPDLQNKNQANYLIVLILYL